MKLRGRVSTSPSRGGHSLAFKFPARNSSIRTNVVRKFFRSTLQIRGHRNYFFHILCVQPFFERRHWTSIYDPLVIPSGATSHGRLMHRLAWVHRTTIEITYSQKVCRNRREPEEPAQGNGEGHLVKSIADVR